MSIFYFKKKRNSSQALVKTPWECFSDFETLKFSPVTWRLCNVIVIHETNCSEFLIKYRHVYCTVNPYQSLSNFFSKESGILFLENKIFYKLGWQFWHHTVHLFSTRSLLIFYVCRKKIPIWDKFGKKRRKLHFPPTFLDKLSFSAWIASSNEANPFIKLKPSRLKV